jgi:general secretion pathway protein D
MVRSGQTASIDVGTEVPLVSSQSTAPDLEGPSILQEVQYRKTGIMLSVTPTVYAGRRVDLAISQEVSEAQPNNVSDLDSPVILNRSLETALSLEDGGSVLLGGMISSSHQRGETGVPFLSDLPVVGQLFRVDKVKGGRTELLMLIVPYVLDNQQEAEAISRAFERTITLPVEAP